MRIFRDVLQEGKEKLLEAGIAEASTDAWYLLAHVTGISKTEYFMRQMEEVPSKEAKEYEALIHRRSQRIPLQHLTHEQEFMGLSFYVNEQVLIPRQDTECLVEEALEVMKAIRKNEEEIRLLDLCTGSGCILLSLLAHGAVKEGIGSDNSKEALCIAEKNKKMLAGQFHGSCQFYCGNLFEAIEGKFQMIVSNPPYIATREIQNLEEEVRTHDPMVALDGGEDGLYFYRNIIAQSPDYLENGGWLLFEIGYNQGEQVSRLMREAGFTSVEVKKDFAGLDRVIKGVYNR